MLKDDDRLPERQVTKAALETRLFCFGSKKINDTYLIGQGFRAKRSDEHVDAKVQEAGKEKFVG